MTSFPIELYVMAIGRAKLPDLMEAARVNRAWRTYISTNEKLLGLIPQRYVIINHPIKIHLASNFLYLPEYEPNYPDLIPIEVSNMRSAMKYGPFRAMQLGETIDEERIVSQEEKNQLIKDLEELPDYRLKSINYLTIQLSINSSFLPFFMRIVHLEHLWISPENMAVVHEIIEKGPTVKSLVIDAESPNVLINDTLLDLIRIKSQKHPVTFPTLIAILSDDNHRFTVSNFIKFIQETNFSNDDHKMDLDDIPITGRKEEWLTWLTANAQSPDGGLFTINENSNIYRFKYLDHSFAIKGMYFAENEDEEEDHQDEQEEDNLQNVVE